MKKKSEVVKMNNYHIKCIKSWIDQDGNLYAFRGEVFKFKSVYDEENKTYEFECVYGRLIGDDIYIGVNELADYFEFNA